MTKKRTSSELQWQLSGPCPTCASPVFYAFRRKEIHVRRTCYHNISYGTTWTPNQPYTVWGTSYTTAGNISTSACSNNAVLTATNASGSIPNEAFQLKAVGE